MNRTIKSLQKDAGLDSKAIAKALNISVQTWKAYVNNPMLMRLDSLYTLAGLLNVNIHVLIHLAVRNRVNLTDSDKWFFIKNDIDID